MSTSTPKPATQAAETLILSLDPSVSLQDQVARGKYGYVNPNYTPDNFRLTAPAAKREVVLYDPRGYVSSEEMIARMKADGNKPAGIDDCLAMGAQHPERQRRNPIVFLGTVWCDSVGSRRVPVLDGWNGGRWLFLCWFVGDWVGGCRFAAVRES